MKRALLLVLFLSGCGPMANRIWPPWEPKVKACEGHKCEKGERCVLKEAGPTCEPKGKAGE